LLAEAVWLPIFVYVALAMTADLSTSRRTFWLVGMLTVKARSLPWGFVEPRSPKKFLLVIFSLSSQNAEIKPKGRQIYY
jgi:hypothetical protein